MISRMTVLLALSVSFAAGCTAPPSSEPRYAVGRARERPGRGP